MDSAFCLSTTSFTLFTIPKVHNRYLSCNSPTRHPFTRRLTSFYTDNNLSSHPPVSSLRASSVSNSATFFTSSVGEIGSAATEGVSEASEVIILDVGGMASCGCAATVRRILENQAQVYVASVDLTKETATVCPVSEAKVVPDWHKQLGDELAKHLTSCGFKSTLREQDTFHGCSKRTPYSDWRGQTFASLSLDDMVFESHKREVEALKVKVKDLLLDTTKELSHNIEFINLLCRLGVSHHFEDEINEQLNHIFTMLPDLLEDNDYDLYTLANLFRVLRRYGYNMSSDVFEKFKDGDGEFKKEISNDVKGIFSLYEACFFAIPGENILDEALIFTKKNLEVLAESSNPPHLQKLVRDALLCPSHRSLDRFIAPYYICYYEEDEFANETLLKFAKLDFNQQQLLHQKELAILAKWWTDTNFAEKIPYVRDRLLEAHLSALGSVPEPEYSLARMMLTKYTVLVTAMDDTYDSCDSIEHLQLLTAAFERFTIDAGDELPEFMKHYYKTVFEDVESNGTKGGLFEDLENNGTKGCSFKTSYLKEMMKEIARSYLVEAHWRIDGKVPSFDEYIINGKITSVCEALLSAAILGMENVGMKEILWQRNDPEIASCAKIICRLGNDLSGLQDEKERGDFPKGVDCYMKQYGVSRDEAIEAIQKMIDNKWKVMNTYLLKPNNMSKYLLNLTFNYARTSFIFNRLDVDVFTYPSNMKQLIKSLFIHPFPM